MNYTCTVGIRYILSLVYLCQDKTDCHNITEILLKVALSAINQTKPNLIGNKISSFIRNYFNFLIY
jgi:hypothetical protein